MKMGDYAKEPFDELMKTFKDSGQYDFLEKLTEDELWKIFLLITLLFTVENCLEWVDGYENEMKLDTHVIDEGQHKNRRRLSMKICNATGNGICVNCNHVPPKVNGYSYGNICRMDVEDILAALEYGNLVCYNTDNGKFYEKTIYEHPRDFVDDGDWIYLE